MSEIVTLMEIEYKQSRAKVVYRKTREVRAVHLMRRLNRIVKITGASSKGPAMDASDLVCQFPAGLGAKGLLVRQCGHAVSGQSAESNSKEITK